MDRDGLKGEEAEQKAKEYLQQKSFVILKQNYRIPQGEIDLIAKDGPVLVFVEVKYLKRSHTPYFPEEQVTVAKQRRLRLAAQCFINEQRDEKSECRFDVVSITGLRHELQYYHIQDAF